MTAAAAPREARDFVYCGRTILADGKLGIELRLVGADGAALAGSRVFAFQAKHHRRLAVGGVYRGAEFTAGQAWGIGEASYRTLWPEAADIAGWRAADQAAEQAISAKKLEADARGQEHLLRALLPYRQAYYRAAVQGRYGHMRAISAMVTTALTVGPRATEKEKS